MLQLSNRTHLNLRQRECNINMRKAKFESRSILKFSFLSRMFSRKAEKKRENATKVANYADVQDPAIQGSTREVMVWRGE